MARATCADDAVKGAMRSIVTRGWSPSILALGVVGVLVGLFVLGLLVVLGKPALGWDEAVYASRSRSLVTDLPASTWNIYRPPGLAVLGLVAAPFGFADVALHIVSLALGVAAIAALAVLGRLVFGPTTALVALLGAAAAPVVMTELPRFHNDLASAGLLIALMALLWHQLEVRDAPDRRLLLAGVLAAGVFYLRYGAVAALVAIAMTTALLWPGQLRRSWRLTAGALVIAGLLALPHVIQAWQATGDPVGILRLSADAAAASTPVAALRGYLRSLPGSLAGWLGIAFLAAAGILTAVVSVAAARRRVDPLLARGLALVLLPAGVTAGALVLFSHAEPRYMVFPLLLGMLAGAEALVRGGRWLGTRLPARVDRRVAAPVAWGVLLVVCGAYVLRDVRAVARTDPPDAPWIAETGRWVRDDAHRRCVVVSTLGPILGWYSTCEGLLLGARGTREQMAAATDPVYVVFTSLDGLRKSASTVMGYRALVTEPPATEIGGSGDGAEVFRLTP